MKSKCIVCGSDLLFPPVYVCENMPNEAQNLPTIDNLEEDKPVDLNLCQCSGCGLVQFDCDPVSYYKDSTRAGERCSSLINLRQQQFSNLITKFNLQGKKIIEIGAGKGGFLKTLQEMEQYNIDEYGIENNLEFVKYARESEGVNVVQGFLEEESQHIKGAPFDAFVSFSYPARLIEPNAMLRCIYNNLTENGVGLVQVPSLEHLLEQGGFFDIARDHIAYYSKKTLRFLLEKNGFEVVEEGKAAELYIYAIVRKRQAINLKNAWKDVDKLTNGIGEFVHQLTINGNKIAVWCAGHFAFTVLSISGIGDKVSYIIDNAEFKQGCYAPASHVPIVGPEHFKDEPVDTIMILGPIYVDEIVKEIKEKCSNKVKIVTVDKNGIKEIET